MGTLYECLREARLEQFYPSFRANGITRSEALINLGMAEFYALGITESDDKRRLVELINIIKEVHSSGFSASPTPQRRGAAPRQPQNSGQGSGDSSQALGSSSPEGPRGGSSNARNRTRPNSRTQPSQYDASFLTEPRLDHGRESEARDRAPNFSAASYLDMLQFMSDSSGSEDVGADNSDDDTLQHVAQAAQRNVSSSNAVRSSINRGAGVERVKSKGYNYGVHKVNTPSKTKPPRSSAQRGVRDDKIKVCVRKRPLTRREQRAKEEDTVAVESTTTLIVNEPKLAVDLKAYTLQHEFIFDEVFHESCSNEDVYTRAARPLISCIFNGGTATCFAYGQTGAGKTHTMLGDEETPGLYLLAGQDIFSIINSGQYGRGLHVWISFFEIYCGQLFDLLNRRNRLHAREDGSRQVCIAGLTETEATDVKSLVQTLQYGNSVRSKGATGVNPDSSRSHAILQLDIRNSEDIKVGKISFIDLAGSERASDVTDTDKQTRMEGAEINQSLLALKECIRSIDQDSRHTPFRQSKLTHILKDSFVGNSRTCMIANISPTQSACENTLNTLRYADRVKELKRDSLRSSTVGQAMNLLMNIPPTAPSIFHPSNILSSSTPMRPQAQARRERQSTPAAESHDATLDISDTPIRGHNMPRRPAVAREVARTQQQQQQAEQTPEVQQPGDAVCLPAPSHTAQRSGASSRPSAHAASAASQGSTAPPPDASPSESDHTDTDSCNVTHQTFKLGAALGERKNAVAGSMDTEFDFPTSDFNNPEEFNDLNHPQPHDNPRSERESSQFRAEQEPVAASGAEMVAPSAVLASDPRRPVLKPVVYRSTDTATSVDQSAVNPKLQSSTVSSPKASQHEPSFKKATLYQELFSSDESLDDDDLLADGPSSQTPNSVNNLAAPPSSSSASTQQSPHTNITGSRRLPIPQPAVSTDLTKFTQRPSLRPTEHQPINDLSSKSGNKQAPQHSQPAHLASEPQHNLSSATQKPSAAVKTRDKSPIPKARSPGMKSPTHHEVMKHPSDYDTLSDNKASPEEHRSTHPRHPRQSPPSLEHTPHPPASPPSGRQPSPPSGRQPSPPVVDRGRSAPSGGFTEALKSDFAPLSDDINVPTRTRRCSDMTADPKSHHHRVASSPTGEKSDDSTESIRASLSDQGQGGHRRHRDTDRMSMRKERSDPMLALNLQRKKQTLPDPQSFSKMLTRSNTPKSGLAHRDAGGLGSGSSWKVIHDHLPSPKSGSGLTPPTPDSSSHDPLAERSAGSGGGGGGGSHSEPSSLVQGSTSGVGSPHQTQDAMSNQNLDHNEQQHFSDGGSSGHDRVRLRDRRSRDGRDRRSPSSIESLGHAAPHHTSTDTSGQASSTGRTAEVSPNAQLNRLSQLPVVQVPVSASRMNNGSGSNVASVSSSGYHQAENTNSAAYFRVATSAASELPNRNTALVTEKLAPGAVFSPIQPYPVTVAGTSRAMPEPAATASATSYSSSSSSVLLQPTPVPVSSSVSSAMSSSPAATHPAAGRAGGDGGGGGGGGQDEPVDWVQKARSELISAHEDQLASITSLCKHEMRLLLNAKKVPGKRGFDDYLRRVSDILQQKMAAIASLQGQISLYRSKCPASSTSRSVTSSVSASVSEGGVAIGASTNQLH